MQSLLKPGFTGIIAIDKPVGPTSHDIIYKIRRLTGEKKVGHAGTLDPLASGVLVVAVGKTYTKQLAQHVATKKTYYVTITLGSTSATDDAEGPITASESVSIPSLETVSNICAQFVGHTSQLPPTYSAIKVAGRRAHRQARAGKEVELEPREVVIYSLDIKKYRWPDLSLTVQTGPGTYIRSLARDIGQNLGTGGYVSRLIRTKVGDYSLEQAIKISE